MSKVPKKWPQQKSTVENCRRDKDCHLKLVRILTVAGVQAGVPDLGRPRPALPAELSAQGFVERFEPKLRGPCCRVSQERRQAVEDLGAQDMLEAADFDSGGFPVHVEDFDKQLVEAVVATHHGPRSENAFSRDLDDAVRPVTDQAMLGELGYGAGDARQPDTGRSGNVAHPHHAIPRQKMDVLQIVLLAGRQRM
jgi:hypothetical protein